MRSFVTTRRRQPGHHSHIPVTGVMRRPGAEQTSAPLWRKPLSRCCRSLRSPRLYLVTGGRISRCPLTASAPMVGPPAATPVFRRASAARRPPLGRRYPTRSQESQVSAQPHTSSTGCTMRQVYSTISADMNKVGSPIITSWIASRIRRSAPWGTSHRNGSPFPQRRGPPPAPDV